MKKFITATDYATATGTPYPTVATWLQRGQIAGAVKARFGRLELWQIPADAPRPKVGPGRPKKGGAGDNKGKKVK